MTRLRRTPALLALLLTAGVVGYLLWTRGSAPIPVTIPVPERIRTDASPLGQLLDGADTVRLEATADLNPGRYRFETAGGPVTVTVPAGAAVGGQIGLRVADRGEDESGRWVRLRPEPSRIVFAPAVRVESRYGVAEVGEIGAEGAGVTATAAPLLRESVAALIGERVWGTAESGPAARPADPFRGLTVTGGTVTLRDGARFRWRGPSPGGPSELVAGPGSEARVVRLTASRVGDLDGAIVVRLAVAPGTTLRAGAAAVALDAGTFEATLAVRRGADGVRVTAGPGATLTASGVRVRPDAARPAEFAADRLSVAFDRLDWDRPAGGAAAPVAAGRVGLTGVTVPGPAGRPGVRLEAVSATVGGDAAAVDVTEFRARVPKRDLLDLLAEAVPGEVAVPDVPVKDNVLDLFRDVRLTDVKLTIDRPAVGFAGDRIAVDGTGAVAGRLRANGRHDVLKTRVQEVKGPFGVTVKTPVPYHEVTWVPRVDAGFRLPVAVRGSAAVRLSAGGNLADARVEVAPQCDAVTFGTPTVEHLPAPLTGVVKLAAGLAEKVKFGGKTPAEHVAAELGKPRSVPLVPHPSADAADFLRRVRVTTLAYTTDADAVIVAGAVAVRLQ